MELVEAPPEELQDAPESGDTFWPWKKEEQISALISEKGSRKEIVEDPQKHVLQPIPTNPTANAKTTYSPLPVYILPTPAEKSKPAAPAPKGKSNPSLHAMQNFKRLVASVHKFATTSKAQAVAYTAWHSGWFWCGFGFGASEPRHFRALLVPAASKGLRKWYGGSTVSPTFCFNFFCLILYYCILF